MFDYSTLLWDNDVFDDTITFLGPILKKLNVQTNHTIACGSGYFVNLLNSLSIQASGSDIDIYRIELAKNNYPEYKFFLADMRNFSLETKVDCITCLDGCINHISSLIELEKVFQSVYKNLHSTGYFYFEYWTLDEVYGTKTYIEKFEKQGYSIEQEEHRYGNNVHNMVTTIKKGDEIIRILNAYHTSFSDEDIQQLLSKAGFKKYYRLQASNQYSNKILAFKHL